MRRFAAAKSDVKLLVGDAFLVALALVLGGLASAVAFGVCVVLLALGGHDASEKHGISHLPSFRIGGVFIVIYLIIFLIIQSFVMGDSMLSLAQAQIIGVSLCFFVVGLVEDITGNLKPLMRLGVMLVVSVGALFMLPDLRIPPLHIEFVDAVLSYHPLIALIAAVLFLAFMPNAFNIADGANGLLPGIVLCFLVLMLVVASINDKALIAGFAAACALFLAHNLLHGRFFLGDGGAYFLGAFVALNIVYVAQAKPALIWPSLCVVFYPIAELVFSILRRLFNGLSPFRADNAHFHNLLYEALGGRARPSVAINNTTGLLTVTLFSLCPLALYLSEVAGAFSVRWEFLYAGLWGVYLALYRLLAGAEREVTDT